MPIVVVPKSLREKLGDDGSEALVELLNAAHSLQKSALDVVSERFERRLAEEVAKLRQELADLRASLLKWMFVFWAVTVGIGYLFRR